MHRLTLRAVDNWYKVIKLENSRSVIQIQVSDPQTHASSNHRADGPVPSLGSPLYLAMVFMLMNCATYVCPGGW